MSSAVLQSLARSTSSSQAADGATRRAAGEEPTAPARPQPRGPADPAAHQERLNLHSPLQGSVNLCVREPPALATSCAASWKYGTVACAWDVCPEAVPRPKKKEKEKKKKTLTTGPRALVKKRTLGADVQLAFSLATLHSRLNGELHSVISLLNSCNSAHASAKQLPTLTLLAGCGRLQTLQNDARCEQPAQVVAIAGEAQCALELRSYTCEPNAPLPPHRPEKI